MLSMTVSRCVIPRFAQCLNRSAALTAGFIPKKLYGYTQNRNFAKNATKYQKETASVTFVCSDGTKYTVDAKVGDNLLDVVIENNIDLDGYGACEGTLACSTCHLIFEKADYNKLPTQPCDEELDMLDLAFGLTDTSRLGCQIVVTKDMDGLVVKVPAGVADAREPS
ncbi:adrenodoxin-like [Dreissena polymorpha]|uniref:adrenodoxin-like n=1 Tax=Dreissena polymorpha TaxID=45954 RepID=UPI002264E9F9|nr:adrenodoxin-like [Dreissena polymorpha]